jgi:regulator of sirC expression with transglutaminase-like and TPR domain
MYCFTKELELIQSVFGDTITTDLEEFNTTDKSYVGQVVSTREGVNLSMAEALIFFNIPFSGTSYTQ